MLRKQTGLKEERVTERVCVCIRIHTCARVIVLCVDGTCVCACVRTGVCKCTCRRMWYVCMYVRVYVCVRSRVYVRTLMYICVHMCTDSRACVRVHMCKYVCVYEKNFFLSVDCPFRVGVPVFTSGILSSSN